MNDPLLSPVVACTALYRCLADVMWPTLPEALDGLVVSAPPQQVVPMEGAGAAMVVTLAALVHTLPHH
jgi:hypothetical protein